MNAVLAAALAAAAAASCSAPALPSELAHAYEREEAGDVDGALAAYRAAEHLCDDPAPSRRRREDCTRALEGEAELLESHGDLDRAIVAYAAMAARSHGNPETSARGLLHAGRLAYERDRVPEAATWLWQCVTTYPDEAYAGDAIEFVVARTRGVDPRTLAARLTQLYPGLDATGVADNLLWWLADLYEHELADPASALALYDRIPVEYPDSGLRDDARWRGALLARSRGDFEGAVRRLRGLTATREVALGAGSYFSIWLDDAQLELGRVLRDDLHRSDEAAAAFARLPKDYPASILIDDALDELAATDLARGDQAGACAAEARLLAHDPESKFAEHARERRASGHCPER